MARRCMDRVLLAIELRALAAALSGALLRFDALYTAAPADIRKKIESVEGQEHLSPAIPSGLLKVALEILEDEEGK